ncbi:MAG: type II toxin-antitoxin system PemK/MazF family toxin [Muribaculaceae bacterium]|nr:type II toxin-antitoxin system PemK/MazF family toxin [Muribaculaceae bacterium]MBQ4006967.1 type II toxin-antitoxin system PemK/MazF family toxin [Muribaculaceae bacterium]
MKYAQKDIVEVNFLFPDGSNKPHPALIVSNNDLHDTEGFFYLVLISSKEFDYSRQYSYPLHDDMLNGCTFAKKSYVKCHIISGYTERDVVRKLGSIKEKYFNEIVDKTIESIF